MKNQDLRKEAKTAGVYLWQIAEYFGVCDMTMSRKFRHELPPDEKQRIRQAIQEIKEESNYA